MSAELQHNTVRVQQICYNLTLYEGAKVLVPDDDSANICSPGKHTVPLTLIVHPRSSPMLVTMPRTTEFHAAANSTSFEIDHSRDSFILDYVSFSIEVPILVKP